MRQSVIVQHTSENYAFVLVATRSEGIVPMIFINKGCDLFAAAPMLDQWVKAGLLYEYDKPPVLREEILKNAVTEYVRVISRCTDIVARNIVRVVPPRVKVSSDEDFDLPPDFELDQEKEPAFFWLFQKADVAVQAMRIIKYLMDKHKISESDDGNSGEQMQRRCIFI